jgi:hypothetical protein
MFAHACYYNAVHLGCTPLAMSVVLYYCSGRTMVNTIPLISNARQFYSQIIQDYERAVIFRLGRLQPVRDPGWWQSQDQNNLTQYKIVIMLCSLMFCHHI